MTEEKDSTIHYLDRTALERIHAVLSDFATRNGDEPIPSIHLAKAAEIESLLAAPKHRFFGIEAYPTIEEKAAILFYTINKRQTFLNGNKRMSTLTLLVFLGINGSMLTVSPDELTEKALWLANTPSLEFPAIKKNLTAWIRDHLQNPSFCQLRHRPPRLPPLPNSQSPLPLPPIQPRPASFLAQRPMAS